MKHVEVQCLITLEDTQGKEINLKLKIKTNYKEAYLGAMLLVDSSINLMASGFLLGSKT